jgi:hypothetical protein
LADRRAKVESTDQVFEAVDVHLVQASQEDAAFGIFTDGDRATIADGSRFWQKQVTELFVVDLDIRLAS